MCLTGAYSTWFNFSSALHIYIFIYGAYGASAINDLWGHCLAEEHNVDDWGISYYNESYVISW